MEFGLSVEELLFLYGRLRGELHKLEALRSHPDCPIAKDSIDADIGLYSAISEKIKASHPELDKLGI